MHTYFVQYSTYVYVQYSIHNNYIDYVCMYMYSIGQYITCSDFLGFSSTLPVEIVLLWVAGSTKARENGLETLKLNSSSASLKLRNR